VKKTEVRGENGAWSKLKANTSCPEGNRTYRCFDQSCPSCGVGKKGMTACPKEISGPGECKWRYQTYDSVPKEPNKAGPQPPPRRGNDDDSSDDEGKTEAEPKPKMRRVLKTKTKAGTRRVYFTYFMRILSLFFWHDYVHNNQYLEYKRSSAELQSGHLWLQGDFAANLEKRNRKETQAGWFSKLQTTILPVVARYVDNDGVIKEEYRVYVNNDLSHSHNFVKECLEECINHYATLFEQKNLQPLTHVAMWSDGCGSQFKNRWQLWWLVNVITNKSHLVSRSGRPIKLQAFTHHFFASCHGKGPCDSCGARTKDKIHKAQLADVLFNSSKEHYEYLVTYATVNEGDRKKRNVTRYVWIAKEDVDTNRPDVKGVKGVKGMHMFRGKPGEKIQMNMLSCTCLRCANGGDGNADDPACRNHKQQRPSAITRTMRLEANAARSTRNAAKAAMDIAIDALEGSKAGDLLLIYVKKGDRKVYRPEDYGRFEKAWDCRGRYRLAQLVETPDLQSLRAASRRLVRPPSIKLFFADEHEPENEYCFPSLAFCHAPGDENPRPWNNCGGGGERTCPLKHYYEREIWDVRLVLGPITSRVRGMSTDATTQAVNIRLAEDEIEAVDEILDDLAETYPTEFGE